MEKASMIVRVAGYYGLTIRLSGDYLSITPRPDPTSQIATVIRINRDLLVAWLKMCCKDGLDPKQQWRDSSDVEKEYVNQEFSELV